MNPGMLVYPGKITFRIHAFVDDDSEALLGVIKTADHPEHLIHNRLELLAVMEIARINRPVHREPGVPIDKQAKPDLAQMMPSGLVFSPLGKIRVRMACHERVIVGRVKQKAIGGGALFFPHPLKKHAGDLLQGIERRTLQLEAQTTPELARRQELLPFPGSRDRFETPPWVYRRREPFHVRRGRVFECMHLKLYGKLRNATINS